MRRSWVVGVTTAAVFMSLATDAEGQRHRRDDAPRANVGFSFLAAEPVGELGYFFDQGFGGKLSVGLPVDDFGLFRVVGDLGFLIYGHEKQQYCMSLPFGCRIDLDLTTTNNIAFGGIGPELAVPLGPIEPYARATMGFSYWFTHSSLSGYDDEAEFGNTTHLSDGMLAWRAGAGVRMRVSNGSKPISIDFGVERHQNGIAEFLTEGDIEDHTDGSITIYPNISEANLLTYHIGISIGIPRGAH